MIVSNKIDYLGIRKVQNSVTTSNSYYYVEKNYHAMTHFLTVWHTFSHSDILSRVLTNFLGFWHTFLGFDTLF